MTKQIKQKRPGRGSDQFIVRLPPGMRDEIAHRAEEHGRSMNAEVIARLGASFEEVLSWEGMVVVSKRMEAAASAFEQLFFNLRDWRAPAGGPEPMLPRDNWKGFLRLSLVTCPIAMIPATVESGARFDLINKKTGNRIRYLKVDAETGDAVDNKDIVAAYKVDTDTYIEVTKEELESVALESTHTIEIDEFVPKSEIDSRYLIRPYYLVPDGKVGHDAFGVIRETIRAMNKVAIARVVLTNREHVIALEPLGDGLMGTLLRYPFEVRSENGCFEDIQKVKITKDMLDLARHIVEKKSASFEPEKFEDHYETALVDLISKKRAGIKIGARAQPKASSNVINLMDALKQSVTKGNPQEKRAIKK